MGDLIDFSPILTLQTTSRPFQKWDLLEPGQRKTSTSSIPSSRSGSVHPASPIPLDDRENKKKDRNLLGPPSDHPQPRRQPTLSLPLPPRNHSRVYSHPNMYQGGMSLYRRALWFVK
jgi:hypothetical protein